MPLILLQTQPPANMGFLFAAFAITWLVFFAYAFFVSRRRQELEREVRDLQQGMEGDEAEGNSGD
jgi:CcmD family protein